MSVALKSPNLTDNLVKVQHIYVLIHAIAIPRQLASKYRSLCIHFLIHTDTNSGIDAIDTG